MEKFFNYMALYYESLQSLVEGRREVLNDENFKFHDQETVKEKQKRFEEKFSKMIGKGV